MYVLHVLFYSFTSNYFFIKKHFIMKGLFKGLLFTLLLFAVTSIMANVVQHPVKTEKHPPGYSLCADVQAVAVDLVTVNIVSAVQVCDATTVFVDANRTDAVVFNLDDPEAMSAGYPPNESLARSTKEDVIIPVAEALPDKAA